jgi:hypothetical protein
MASNFDNPLPPPVSRRASEPAGARVAARAELVTPEFNALGPSTQQGPRTIDEQRTLDLDPAPQGSKDYVAGQPVDAEEAARTESLAAARDRAAGPDLVTPEGIKKAREQEGEL